MWLVGVTLRDGRKDIPSDMWFHVWPERVRDGQRERDAAAYTAEEATTRILRRAVKCENFRLFRLPDITSSLELPPKVARSRAGGWVWAIATDVSFQSKIFSSPLYFFADCDGVDEDDAAELYSYALHPLFRTKEHDPPIVPWKPRIVPIPASWFGNYLAGLSHGD